MFIGLAFSACGQSQVEMEDKKLIDKVYNSSEEIPVEVQKTEEEWRSELTEDQYAILREASTERAFTGKYWNSNDVGTYYSAATGQALFRSDAKFDSGCGWPSFFEPIDKEAITYKSDKTLGMQRIEILDSKSGSHLGHVFNDGPPPTGLRYCLNSEAMVFVPDGEDPADYGVVID